MVDDTDDDRDHLRDSNCTSIPALAQCGELALRGRLGNHPYRLQSVSRANLPLWRFGANIPHLTRFLAGLVALGAAIFAHEAISVVSAIGIALVSGGILSLACFQGKRVRADFLPAAFTTGVLIGAYTVVDGIGVRLSGNSLVV